MRKISFFVPGPPQGKQRARTVTVNGRRMSYTPQKTRDYERLIAQCFRKAGGFLFPEGEPVFLFVSAAFPVPKSYGKKKAMDCRSGRRCPLVKPDGDNILKAVSDALNGLAYPDDSHLVWQAVFKRYAEIPENVGITVSLWSTSP